MSVEWPVLRLTEIVKLPVGQVDPRQAPHWYQTLLAPDHIESGTGRITAHETAESQGASSGKYVVRPGDVVFSKIRPALRKVVVADFEGTCSADMYPLRAVDGVLPLFVQALLLSEHFSRYVESVSGRTGIPKVNRSDLAEYVLRLPPMTEQRHIVEVLAAMAKEESALEASVEKTRTMRSGVIEALLSSPAWDAQLADLLSGPPRNGYSPAATTEWHGTQMLGLGCLTPDGFEPRQLKNAPSAVSFGHFAMLSDGDLLMSRANTRDLVGLAGTYRDIGTPCIYPDLMMRLTLTQGWSAKALEVVLRSPRARRQIRALAQGTSESMVKISGQSVKTVSVPELSVAEQAQLVGVVRNFEEQVTQDQRKLIKLRQLKQGLTSDLLSGRGRLHKVV